MNGPPAPTLPACWGGRTSAGACRSQTMAVVSADPVTANRARLVRATQRTWGLGVSFSRSGVDVGSEESGVVL